MDDADQEAFKPAQRTKATLLRPILSHCLPP